MIDADRGRAVAQHRRWTAAGASCAAVVFVVRLGMSWGRHEYAIWPDEPAQLAVARFIGGGTPWNMHNHSVWRPMFGTMLAPVYWFTDDPVTVLHVGLLLNAILGGVAAWLLVLLARRLTSMSIAGCVSVSLLVSLSPAMLFTTDFVFSESLIVPLYLGTLWCLLRFQETPTLHDGLAAGVLAALAFGTHGRMLPLTVVVIGVAALAALRGRLAKIDAVAIVGVAGAAAFMMSVYTSYLVERLWNEPSTRNSVGGVLEQFTTGSSVAFSLAGQTWSLLVASAGVVAYGAVELVRAAGRRGSSSDDARDSRPPTPADARMVLVVFALCAGLSVVFMADRWRSDQLVYGRYNAAVVAPLLVVGLAALMQAVPARRLLLVVPATAATTVALGALLWGFRREVLRTDNGLEPMILGLQPFMVSPDAIEVPRMTVLAVLAILVIGAVPLLIRAPRARLVAVVAVTAVAVLVGSALTRSAADRWDDSGDASAVAALRGGLLDDEVPVDYFLPPGSNNTVPMMLYQFYLPRTPVTVVDDPLGGTGRYVFAPIGEQALAASDAQLVWTDPRRGIGLWRR